MSPAALCSACGQCKLNDSNVQLICRCSSGYDLRQYPGNTVVGGDVALRELNTQVAEQVNALLENVRTQVRQPAHARYNFGSVLIVVDIMRVC